MKPYVYLLGVTLVCEYSDFEKGLAWMGEGGEAYVTSCFCPQAVAHFHHFHHSHHFCQNYKRPPIVLAEVMEVMEVIGMQMLIQPLFFLLFYSLHYLSSFRLGGLVKAGEEEDDSIIHFIRTMVFLEQPVDFCGQQHQY